MARPKNPDRIVSKKRQEDSMFILPEKGDLIKIYNSNVGCNISYGVCQYVTKKKIVHCKRLKNVSDITLDDIKFFLPKDQIKFIR